MPVVEKNQRALTLASVLQEVKGYMGMRVVKIEEGKLLSKKPLLRPGEVLQDLFGRISMSSEDASEISGIPLVDLAAIFNGQAKIDEGIRDRLNLLREGAGETLFQYQKTYDYYLIHGRLPF